MQHKTNRYNTTMNHTALRATIVTLLALLPALPLGAQNLKPFESSGK